MSSLVIILIVLAIYGLMSLANGIIFELSGLTLRDHINFTVKGLWVIIYLTPIYIVGTVLLIFCVPISILLGFIGELLGLMK